MRSLVVAMLVGILASCPILCGTVEATLGIQHQGGAPHDDGAAPYPVNDDCCVCNGALKANNSGDLTSSGVANCLWLPIDVMGALPPIDLTAHCSPTPPFTALERAGPLGHTSGLAWLQAFRC